MKVKKRTVWMLTLLSLVAVISVYYLNEPNNMAFDGLALFSDDGQVKVEESNSNEVPVLAQSSLFEEMRMEVQNERSQTREQLESKIATNELTADEINEAYSTMQDLTKRETVEAMLEMLIKNLGYSDALVRTGEGKVLVTVVSSEHSTAQADEIIYTVKKEWEDAKEVKVEFDDAP
ncbi:MAG: SpoIIIAH-like family protein [Paenisporosarcina sp.]